MNSHGAIEKGGKIFSAEVMNPTCSCGKVVHVESFSSDRKQRTRIGFCPCGNIFIGHYPTIV